MFDFSNVRIYLEKRHHAICLSVKFGIKFSDIGLRLTPAITFVEIGASIRNLCMDGRGVLP